MGTSGTFPSQGAYRTALELEYGLTTKITGAYYANFVHPSGEGMQYAGSKFRLRGRFAEKDELHIDMGWYAELEWWQPNVDANTLEAEVLLILHKDIGNWTFIANAPDIDKVIVGPDRHEVFELSYRFEALYRLSEMFIPGLQLFGGVGQINAAMPLNQQQQYLIPVIHTVLPFNMHAEFGAGPGLTPGSDPFMVQANLYFGGADDGTWEGKILRK